MTCQRPETSLFNNLRLYFINKCFTLPYFLILFDIVKISFRTPSYSTLQNKILPENQNNFLWRRRNWIKYKTCIKHRNVSVRFLWLYSDMTSPPVNWSQINHICSHSCNVWCHKPHHSLLAFCVVVMNKRERKVKNKHHSSAATILMFINIY